MNSFSILLRGIDLYFRFSIFLPDKSIIEKKFVIFCYKYADKFVLFLCLYLWMNSICKQYYRNS